jgi:hypothetical protein
MMAVWNVHLAFSYGLLDMIFCMKTNKLLPIMCRNFVSKLIITNMVTVQTFKVISNTCNQVQSILLGHDTI